MTKIEELQNMANELLAEIEKLKAKEEIKIFPQVGDKYWYYEPIGHVKSSVMPNIGIRVNSYRTKEEAERARDTAFAKQRVKHSIKVANDGWTPDWSDEAAPKYTIEAYSQELGVECYFFTKTSPNWMYMRSKEIAEQILASHKEDLELIFSE